MEALSLLLGVVAGILVFLKIPALDAATRASYAVFDVAVTVLLIAAILSVLRGVAQQFRDGAGRVQSESQATE
jgi:Flp pilus assembly pilin Flp